MRVATNKPTMEVAQKGTTSFKRCERPDLPHAHFRFKKYEGTVAAALANRTLGASDQRCRKPKTRISTARYTAVEMTDTSVYRIIFLPVGVWYRAVTRSLIPRMRFTLGLWFRIWIAKSEALLRGVLKLSLGSPRPRLSATERRLAQPQNATALMRASPRSISGSSCAPSPHSFHELMKSSRASGSPKRNV